MESVIRNFHEQYGHFGVSKVYSLMYRYFYARKLRAKIGLFIRSCDVCQKCKFPNRALSGEMHPIVTEQSGELFTVDYYGPLPESRSRVSYILVVIDSFSKFVKLYPLCRAQAKISAQRVLDFHRTVPIKVVLSDHGTQFQSKQWQETLKHVFYYCQTRPVQPHGACHEGILSKIKLMFNVTPHISTGYSPYKILSSKTPTNPLSKLLWPLLPAVPLRPVDQIRADVRVHLQRAAERATTFCFGKVLFRTPPRR
jgi:hypothetical protein